VEQSSLHPLVVVCFIWCLGLQIQIYMVIKYIQKFEKFPEKFSKDIKLVKELRNLILQKKKEEEQSKESESQKS